MKATNTLIRIRAMENGVRLWEIADELGIARETLSRKLRKELSDEERERILSIIDELAGGGSIHD